MNAVLRNALGHAPLLALALAGAGVVGLALAMWMNHGAEIFLALVESGLAWCL